jgi:cobalt-zinc-cadmium efflux system protein
MLRETIEILMEAKPGNLNITELTEAMQQVDKVCGVHHLHVWRLDEHSTLLESHVVIQKEDVSHMEEIKTSIKKVLYNEFGISHSTLEFEFEPCDSHKHEVAHIHDHKH